MRLTTRVLAIASLVATIACTAVFSRPAGAVAIAVPPAPTDARYTGFLQPNQEFTHACLITGLIEPPSASGAGVSPFIVSLGGVGAASGAGVSPFNFQAQGRECVDARCAYTFIALDSAGASAVVGLGLNAASEAIGNDRTFSSVFGSTEAALVSALLADNTATLVQFFLDNVGKLSGAGVSPFLPELARVRPGANPTPHPDCPPLAAFASSPGTSPGANPTPHPDCPGPSALVSFGNASFAGVANAQVVAGVPEPAVALLLAGGLLGLTLRSRPRRR